MTPQTLLTIRRCGRRIAGLEMVCSNIGMDMLDYTPEVFALILQYEPDNFIRYFDNPAILRSRWEVWDVKRLHQKYPNIQPEEYTDVADELDNGKYLVFIRRGAGGTKGSINCQNL